MQAVQNLFSLYQNCADTTDNIQGACQNINHVAGQTSPVLASMGNWLYHGSSVLLLIVVFGVVAYMVWSLLDAPQRTGVTTAWGVGMVSVIGAIWSGVKQPHPAITSTVAMGLALVMFVVLLVGVALHLANVRGASWVIFAGGVGVMVFTSVGMVSRTVTPPKVPAMSPVASQTTMGCQTDDASDEVPVVLDISEVCSPPLSEDDMHVDHSDSNPPNSHLFGGFGLGGYL